MPNQPHPTPSFTLPTPATILDVQEDNYRTKTFVLDAALDAHPGQFVMAWLPRFDEKPFSLVHADPVTLMITTVGPFTRLVHELEPGDRLWIRGPFGRGFHVDEPGRRLALVAGGYGVAPLLWLARTQLDQAAALTVILGARQAADVLYADRFREAAQAAAHQNAPFQLIITTEDGSQGRRGLVTDALAPMLAAGEVDLVCACGPDGMLRAIERLATAHHVPAQLSWEAYMRCGIGICGACEHEGVVLCMEGPVVGVGDGEIG